MKSNLSIPAQIRSLFLSILCVIATITMANVVNAATPNTNKLVLNEWIIDGSVNSSAVWVKPYKILNDGVIHALMITVNKSPMIMYSSKGPREVLADKVFIAVNCSKSKIFAFGQEYDLTVNDGWVANVILHDDYNINAWDSADVINKSNNYPYGAVMRGLCK